MTSARHSADSEACVVLIGLRGSGKSVVGRALAELLGGAWVDTDEMVVADSGMSIAVLFETEGEAGFRKRESQAVARAVATRPAVISVGGGAVLEAKNVALLKGAGEVVWLTAPPEVLLSRIMDDKGTPDSRPRLTDLDDLEEMRLLQAKRHIIYENIADLILETSERTPEEIAKVIVEGLSREMG